MSLLKPSFLTTSWWWPSTPTLSWHSYGCPDHTHRVLGPRPGPKEYNLRHLGSHNAAILGLTAQPSWVSQRSHLGLTVQPSWVSQHSHLGLTVQPSWVSQHSHLEPHSAAILGLTVQPSGEDPRLLLLPSPSLHPFSHQGPSVSLGTPASLNRTPQFFVCPFTSKPETFRPLHWE